MINSKQQVMLSREIQLMRESGQCKPREVEYMQSTQRTLNIGTCKLRDFVNPHSGGINALDLETVEGRYLLTGGGKGGVLIYDVCNVSGTPQFRYEPFCSVSEQYKHKFSVETVQWYPFDNGLFTTSGADKELKIWDANELIPAETYEFSGIVYNHHMSPCATEHNLIAVGTSSSQVKLVDMRTGSSIQVLKGHSKSVFCVKWSPCLPFIVTTGGYDGRIFFWDIRMAKGQLISLDQHNGQKSVGAAHTGNVLGMEFLDDGYHLVSYGSDDTIRLWNTFTGKNQLVNYGKVENDLQRNLKIGVSSGTHEPLLYIPEEERIRVFSVMTGRLLKTLSGHFRQVVCCHYNPYNQEVYSGSNDRNLLVWTPDQEVEKIYTNYLESIRNKPQYERDDTSKKSTVASVLADTWSDDDD